MKISNTFGWRQRLLTAALATLAGVGQAQTPINDIPMVVNNSVAPNFMFMIDNSGSMDAIVAERNRDAVNPYDAATDYTPAGCTGTNVVAAGSRVNLVIDNGAPRFTVGTSGNLRHFSLALTGNDRRCFARNSAYTGELLANSNMDGTYSGNYLNWYFGNAGGHPVTGWGSRKVLNRLPTAGGGTMLVSRRIDVVRTATNRVIDSLPNPAANGESKVRVGLSAYYNASGTDRGGRLFSAIRDLTGTSLTDTTNSTTAVGRGTFKNIVNGLSAGGATPLASTLADIGRYFATGSTTARMPSGSVNLDGDGGLLRVSGSDQPTARNACLTVGAGSDRSTCTAATTPRPVQYWCQRSYAFFLTDGLPNGDRSFNNNALLRDYDGDCTGPNAANCVSNGAAGSWDRKNARTYLGGGSDYLDDVAKALFDADLRPDLVKPAVANDPNLSAYDNWKRQHRNNVRVYPMGFADPIVANDPLLVSTGVQGGGRFVSAADESALDREFKSVINDAFARESAAAAVGVASTELNVGNVSYLGSYIPGAWTGSLKAFSLDSSTGAFIQPPLWDFAAKLRQQVAASGWQSRKIVSIKANGLGGDQGVAFTPANFALQPTTLLPEVIDFIRGDESRDGRSIPNDVTPIFTFRDRQDLLGDIINAEPVVVEEGGNKYLFQAANDGMLHVINGNAAGAGAGEELWAYVPRLIHGRLHDLASVGYVHQYFVDATPAVARLGSSGPRLLVGGLGKGGRGYYALDVSNPAATSVADAASKVRWEFIDADMGLSFGTPEIVRIANTSVADGWRVVVTSGLNNPNGRGYVYVLNPDTGAVINKIDTGVGTALAPAGLAHLSRMAHAAPDATVRYLYGGDLLGNVWRVDLDNASVTRIAQLTGPDGQAQPITAPLEIGPAVGTTSKVFVYVGTGKYLADADVPGSPDATAQALYRQSMYGIIDDLTVAAPTMPSIRGTNGTSCPSGGGDGAFVCQTLTPHPTVAGAYNNSIHTVDPSAKRGWYIDWPTDANLTNARIYGKPALARAGMVVLSVNVPSSAKCAPGGSSWFFSVWGQSGGAVPRQSSNTTSLSVSDYFDRTGLKAGDVLLSRFKLLTGGSTGTLAIATGSDATVKIFDPPPPAIPVAIWRRSQFRSVK